MRESVLLPAGRHTRLVFDCGADEQETEIVMDERGMRFLSRWEFPLGTQLALNCTCECQIRCPESVRLEGIVVWSERRPRPADQPPLFDTTVLFLDLPDHLRQSVREFSHRLELAE